MEEWKTVFLCASCKQEITFNQKMYSHGRCPHCGDKADDAGSIVNCHEKAYRMVRDGSWWMFWRPFKKEWREESTKNES